MLVFNIPVSIAVHQVVWLAFSGFAQFHAACEWHVIDLVRADYKQGRAECGVCGWLCGGAWGCLGWDQRGPSGPVQCCVSCSHCTYDGLLVFLLLFLQQNPAIKLLCNDVVLV